MFIVFVVFNTIITHKGYICIVSIVSVVLDMVTISISEETHTELKKIKGSLMASNGRERSFDEVIMNLVKRWKSQKT